MITPPALATNAADPLPSTPSRFLEDRVIARTVEENPCLFKISMSIASNFSFSLTLIARLLTVLHGLRFGFWLCAEEMDNRYPDKWDESHDCFTAEDLKEQIQWRRKFKLSFSSFTRSSPWPWHV